MINQLKKRLTPVLKDGACAAKPVKINDISQQLPYIVVKQAQDNAKPDDSYAPLADRVKAIETWQREVEDRLDKLESGSSTDPGALEEPSSSTNPGALEEPADEWLEYKQPTGAHDAYHVGDKITYNGKHYTCVYDGCVWTPDD